jgi:hypothetical protein
MTAEKKAREQRLRERREEKRSRKAARKEAAGTAHPEGPDGPPLHPAPQTTQPLDAAG